MERNLLKISPSSRAGAELQRFRVPADELRATRFFGAPRFLMRGGLTIGLPFGRVVVLINRRFLRKAADGELIVDRQLALIRHELCHAAQNRQWGFIGYWARHLWTRIATRSLMARQSSFERPCYEALDRVKVEHPEFIDSE